jgi:hypothetical protein
VFRVLSRDLSGRLYGDKGCISSSLFELLFCDGMHLVTGIAISFGNALHGGFVSLIREKSSISISLSSPGDKFFS